MQDFFVMTLMVCWFSTGECIVREGSFWTERKCTEQAVARIEEFRRDGIDFAEFSCVVIHNIKI